MYAVRQMGTLDTRERFPRGFFVLVFGTLALLMAGVVGLNLLAEHVGNERVTDMSVNNGTLPKGISERGAKYQLLNRHDRLDFIFLGNSRVQRWDPAVVTQATGARGFNAGVVGSTLGDFTALVQWVHERSRQRDERAPHFVIVTPIESFGAEVAADTESIPELRTRSTRSSRTRDRLQRFKRLTQWQSLKQSLSILRREFRSSASSTKRGLPQGNPVLQRTGAVSPQPGETTTSPSQLFRADGYLRAGAFFQSNALEGASQGLTGFVDGQVSSFYTDLAAAHGFTQVEPAARSEFQRLLAAANAAGDTPTIVIPPISAASERRFHSLGRDRYERTVISWLDSLHDQYDFRVLDYSNAQAFSPYETRFFDGQHPRPSLARALVMRLTHDDKLMAPHR